MHQSTLHYKEIALVGRKKKQDWNDFPTSRLNKNVMDSKSCHKMWQKQLTSINRLNWNWKLDNNYVIMRLPRPTRAGGALKIRQNLISAEEDHVVQHCNFPHNKPSVRLSKRSLVFGWLAAAASWLCPRQLAPAGSGQWRWRRRRRRRQQRQAALIQITFGKIPS